MDTGAIADLLRDRGAALAGELETLTAVPRDPMAAVSFGKRVGDGTTEAVDRLNKVGAANSIAATLADVDRALAKIEEGTYGVCDRCGAEIPPERLEAIPWAALCVGCAAAR